MNKRCVALTDEQYRESISLLRSGFILDEKLIKPNERIAAVEVLQATLGLRLGRQGIYTLFPETALLLRNKSKAKEL